MASSISGYCTEIGARQPRHRPRSASQATIGMFSYQRRPRPHLGQRDGGRTTDSLGSAPQRRMQTLRKLPMQRAQHAGIADEHRIVSQIGQINRHA